MFGLKKKKWMAGVSLLLALLIQLSVLTPFSVRAAGTTDAGTTVSFPFIDTITLTDTTTGKVLGGTDVTGVGKSDAVSVEYDFSIPNGQSVAAGTTYTFTIPNQIALSIAADPGYLTKDLYDSDNVKMATVKIDKSGSGTVTFENYTATHSNVGGKFTLSGQFDPSNIGNTTPVPIEFDLNGTNDPVNVYFSQPATTDEKSGSYDAATGTVTWTVKLNTNLTTVTNGDFTDVITPGKPASGSDDPSQTYVDGSFKVTKSDGTTVVYNSADQSGAGTFTYTPAQAGDTAKTGTLDYKFADSISETYFATFKTKLSDPSQYFGKSVSNQAKFSHDGTSETPSASVQVGTPDYIDKTGTYNSTTKQIDWTVKFNNDGYSLHSVTVTDPLPTGLTLDKSSVKLTVGGATNTVTEGGAVGQFSYTGTTLVYSAGDITKAETLSFSTDLPADYWQQNHTGNQFPNTATIKSVGDNSYLDKGATGSSDGVGIGNSVVAKTGAYNKENHTITWTVTVNGDKQSLADAQLTDTIPAGQAYQGDFSVTASSGGVPNNGATGGTAPTVTAPGDPATGNTTLFYDFGSTSASYTIVYTTKVLDPAAWAGNSNIAYTNKAVLNPGGGIPSSTVTGSTPVSSDVIDKSAASYDYTTHEITWKIVVNQSQLPLTNAVVTDVLKNTARTTGLDDFDLETGSIQVNNAVIGTGVGSTPYYAYDTGSKTLKVYLGDLNSSTDQASRTKIITFITKLNKTGADYDSYFGQNGNHTIQNMASLSTDENSNTDSNVAKQTIGNTLVGKTGNYTSGKAYIDWAVEINQNGIAISNLKLTDTLQEGLELDTSSVKLYKQTLTASGSLTPGVNYSGGTLTVGGTPEKLTGDNIAYDASTRTFTFTMPLPVTQQPYLLTFRTTVADTVASGTSFSNQISFAGESSGQQSTTGGTQVAFSSLDGTAWGTTGSVTVQKTDTAGGAGLSGAEFGLYDQYGNLLRISAPTASNGNAVFSHLLFDTQYTVSEYTAPDNYEKSADSYTFKLNSDGTIQMLDASGNPSGSPKSGPLVLKDTRKVGTVSFTKTGDGNQPLTGAVFALCDASGNVLGGYPAVTTGSDGVVKFSNIPYGSYQIKETSAPGGYLPLTIPVDLTDGNAAIVTTGTSHTLDLGTKQDSAGGSLTVLKSGAEYAGGPTAALANAVFEVLDSAGKTVGQAVTTDSNGQAAFSNLPVGSYTLHEVSAPAGYQTVADDAFTISAGDSAAQRQLTYRVTDVKKAGSIQFVKTDGQNPLPGAVFKLYDADGKNPVSNAGGVMAATSGADGKVQFTDVPYGSYTIVESSAPADYATMDPIPVTLSDSNGGTADLGTVADKLKTGTIRFTKTDGYHALQDAQFTLSGNGITPMTVTSDKNGTVEFDNLPYSAQPYTISETQAPAAYYQKAADFTVTLNDATADESQTVTLDSPVVDVPLGSITLTKTGADGNPLPGAVFEVYDASGRLVQTAQPSGSDGRFTFTGLPLNPTGDTAYTIREKTAPANYAKTADFTVTLQNVDGSRDKLTTVADSLKTGTIQLRKVDQDGNGLNGATFTLFDPVTGQPVRLNGVTVQAVSKTVGSQTGVVLFTGIPYGSYTIRETGVPTDYVGSDDILVANLTDQNPAVSLNTLILGTPVTNTIRTADIRLTKLGTGGAPLQGATFTLYDAAGKKPMSLHGAPVRATSDAQGQVTLSGIPYGDYTLVETAAPADYAVCSPIPVSLHTSLFDCGRVEDELLTSTVAPTANPKTGNRSRLPWTEAAVVALLICSAAFSGKLRLHRRGDR